MRLKVAVSVPSPSPPPEVEERAGGEEARPHDGCCETRRPFPLDSPIELPLSPALSPLVPRGERGTPRAFTLAATPDRSRRKRRFARSRKITADQQVCPTRGWIASRWCPQAVGPSLRLSLARTVTRSLSRYSSNGIRMRRVVPSTGRRSLTVASPTWRRWPVIKFTACP